MKFFKINIPKYIIILTALSVVLNLLRVIIWGKESFIYILWNIFLAFIPFIISYFLLYYYKKEKFNKIVFILGSTLWILFIPNAPYIITDFVHLGVTRSVPIIYDILLLFSSASLGLIIYFLSLSHIEQIMNMKYTKRISNLIMVGIILMTSFGIYLGRFLRFNSWDIFINHTSLIKNIWKIFSESAVHVEVYLYTILFFFFLYLTYNAWKQANTK